MKASLSYNILHNCLTKRGLPESIAHNILIMVYHVEHREILDEDMQWNIIDNAFCYQRGMCKADPKTAVNHFYECDCCERHQYNKALIADQGLMIVTKPCIFTAYRYSGRVPPPPDMVFDNEDEREKCHCICRNHGRSCARMWLEQEKGHGKEYMLNPSGNPAFTHALGIHGHIHHQPLPHHNNH